MKKKSAFLYNFIKKCIVVSVTLSTILLLSCTQTNITAGTSYLELNLNDTLSTNPFALRTSSLDIFRVIEKASKDDGIKGIILNIESIYRSRDYLWELRSALEKFKASGENGKKIVAFISNADIDIYMLASVADKIVMDELGLLTIEGYAMGGGYVKQSLDKLGVGVTELRYFEYKSATEMLTRTNMSEADRRQTTDYLDDIFTLTRSSLMEARGWTLEEFNSLLNGNFMHSAQSALSSNLIDYTGREDAVKKAVEELEDQSDINYLVFGNNETSLTARGKTGILQKYTVSKGKNNQTIAVVYANGETDMTQGMQIAKLAKIITEQADNSRVKAIVVRMNSPGGSAQAAEALSEAIRYAKEKKPVIVSMGQLAASGGYWASINASHIMATPYTITGSIGVISSWFYDNGLYEKLGFTTDIIKRGEHSDLMTGILIPYRKLTAQEEGQYKKYIIDLYDIFVDKVAVARNMETEKVEAVAQGRIFSGTRALEAELIDSIGSFSDALEIARELASIPEDIAVNYREYPEPTFFERMMSNMSVTAKVFGDERSPAGLIDMLLPDSGIKYRLENNGRVMPMLPLEFSVLQ